MTQLQRTVNETTKVFPPSDSPRCGSTIDSDLDPHSATSLVSGTISFAGVCEEQR